MCWIADCQAGLDQTVVETRFNVVRSSVPDIVTTVRRLRDYLRPEADTAQRRPPDVPSVEPAVSGMAWPRGGR